MASFSDEWREGARSGDAKDVCPACGTPGCIFASDFRAFGRHSVRACTHCASVYDNGKLKDKLVVTPPAQTTQTTG